MTEEQAKKLLEPFPASAIGKLPKPTKKDNPKGKCDVCGGYHGLPAVHLDYVGHAATTYRLLQVDPEWTWEPMAHGENGEPLFTNGGLWIWLTVAGVRRPGFGDGSTPKEVIGDAIRNAAMRFGVALDLWAKEDLHADEHPAPPQPPLPDPPPPATPERPARPTRTEGNTDPDESPSQFPIPAAATDGSDKSKGKAFAIRKSLEARDPAYETECKPYLIEHFDTDNPYKMGDKLGAATEWMHERLQRILAAEAPASTGDDDIPF